MGPPAGTPIPTLLAIAKYAAHRNKNELEVKLVGLT